MKISIEALTRVEGEGKLELYYKEGKLERLMLCIYEPPRFIEGILKGKPYHVIPDITARICGICPVAYQMSGVKAIEMAFGVSLTEEINKARKLMYFGEWIQSHALHIFFLHLPDFYQVPSVVELAKTQKELVLAGMEIKRVGSLIIQELGGRTSHPVSVVAGGFSHLPEDLSSLIEPLEKALEKALWVSERLKELDFPTFELDLPFLSLYDEEDYPILEGVLFFEGQKLRVEEFKKHFVEFQVPYSNAKHSTTKDRRVYLTGPLARFNNAFDKLNPTAKELAKKLGIEPPIKNPYKSLLVRLVEIVHAIEGALDLVRQYKKPERVRLEVFPKASEGFGATEAPRGLLWHHYRFDDEGRITFADIVPPTSQNQGAMERALFVLLDQQNLAQEERIRDSAEAMIRNFDPCISCATHFLKVRRHV